MYTYPYQILKKKITTDVPELKEIDWFLHQYDPNKKQAGFMTAEPGFYIEFPEIDTEQLGYGIQMADVEWTAHLVTQNVYENDKRIEKVNATDHAVIMDKIFKSLLNWSSKISYLPEFASLASTANDQRIIGTIARKGITPPHMLNGLMVTKQRFRCVMYDHASLAVYTHLTGKPIDLSSMIIRVPLP